jgi:16S rRNA (uracil1498-N3)-methyltransferase
VKRFYSEEISGDSAILSEEESHHCLQVLRLENDTEVEVTDGSGHLWMGTVYAFSKKKAVIHLKTLLEHQEVNPAKCALAVALTKNHDRLEWLIEKATESGLTDFYPLITKRTERAKIRVDRLEKIAVSAMKQSLRLWKPVIHEPITFDKLLALNFSNTQKCLAHCESFPERVSLTKSYRKGDNCLMAIGPEGDFTPEEIHEAMQHHFTSISLGEARLRVETAALAACNWIYLSNGS